VTRPERGKASELLASNLPCPPVNVGARSTPNYAHFTRTPLRSKVVASSSPGIAPGAHEHDGAQSHDHDRHDLDHPGTAPPHVAVVARWAGGAVIPSLVFPELRAGSYELYHRPAGPVQLTVRIVGGEVTQAAWP
jgi:hypothetical protein